MPYPRHTKAEARSCSFTVPGKPATKGSMVPMRSATTGKVMALWANRDKLKAWEARVALAAREAWRGPPSQEPMLVGMHFQLARPQSHYGTGRNAGKLKSWAPKYPTGKRNDIDKLERAVLDGLTGVVYADDGQVCEVRKSRVYGTVGVDIRVEELPNAVEQIEGSNDGH